MKKIFTGLTGLALVVSQAMAADLSCQDAIYNSGSVWSGGSYTTQFPGKVIYMSMSFNSNISEMTVSDSLGENFVVPVNITCKNSNEFLLKDQLPEDGPGHMQFNAVVINNNELDLVGSKTLHNDPNIYAIGGKLIKNN